MKESKKMDPIEVADKATNRGNALRHSKKIYNQHWKEIADYREHEKFIEKQWKPCISKLRKAFRVELNRNGLNGSDVHWIGQGFCQNGVTKKVNAILNYEIFMKGMFFKKSFIPENVEEVEDEAFQVSQVLNFWKEVHEK